MQCSHKSVMFGLDTDRQVNIERRRREEAVKVGRQEVLAMELERQLERRQRMIQELLRRNQGLERLLGEIEKEKQEEQQEALLEAARRRTVVKVWRLQVKMMERQRMLEKLMGLALTVGSAVQERQDILESFNMSLEHTHSEDVLEWVEGLKIEEDGENLRFFGSDDLVDIER